MAERRRRGQGPKHTAVVLIRGVLEESPPLDELPDGQVVCRASVSLQEDATLDVVAFGKAAHALSTTLPGNTVALVGVLRVLRTDRPDGKTSQTLTVEVQRVRAIGPSINHRCFCKAP